MSNTQARPVIANVTAQPEGTLIFAFVNGEIVTIDTGFDLSNYGGLPYLPEIAMAAMLLSQQKQIAELRQEIEQLKNK